MEIQLTRQEAEASSAMTREKYTLEVLARGLRSARAFRCRRPRKQQRPLLSWEWLIATPRPLSVANPGRSPFQSPHQFSCMEFGGPLSASMNDHDTQPVVPPALMLCMTAAAVGVEAPPPSRSALSCVSAWLSLSLSLGLSLQRGESICARLGL
jgi:hypothetical protein